MAGIETDSRYWRLEVKGLAWIMMLAFAYKQKFHI